MTKEELTAYVTQLCKEKNYTEEQTKKAIEMATGDDDVAKLLGPLIDLPLGRQSEFSREMNGLKDKYATLTAWHKGAKAAFDAAETRKVDLESKVGKYRDKYGELEGGGDPAAPPKQQPAVIQPNIDELLNNRDQFYLRLQADLGRVRFNHARMFKGEILDDSELLNEIGKAAAEPEPRQITVEQAYQAKYGDRVKTEQERLVKEHDQKLREEGATAERKRLSAAGMKTGANVPESSTLFTAINSETKKDDADRNRSPEDRLSIFEQELSDAMAKNDQPSTSASATGS